MQRLDASPNIEIGWWPMQTTDSAAARAWFGEFAGSTPTVIQWHYESFAVPAGAELIGSSEACAQQAFAIDTLLAMQFHIEIDAANTRCGWSASQRELVALAEASRTCRPASVMARRWRID